VSITNIVEVTRLTKTTQFYVTSPCADCGDTLRYLASKQCPSCTRVKARARAAAKRANQSPEEKEQARSANRDWVKNTNYSARSWQARQALETSDERERRLASVRDARRRLQSRYNEAGTSYYAEVLKRNRTEAQKIAIKLRRLIIYALDVRDLKKQVSSEEIFGCTGAELRQHLEQQFEPGMSWDNHTIHGWHVDHIVPCAKFDLTLLSEQKKCFHYTNLRPLWATENWSKGAK
jgi:uncharacterized Zn finger protein (UPF0148 family)